MDKDFYILDKNDIKKKYGLSDENIEFYTQMGLMEEIKKGQYKVKKKIDSMLLDKKTVFKYCFEDNWLDEIKDFAKSVQYGGKVKRYSKEEIDEMNRKLREQNEKKTKKRLR